MNNQLAFSDYLVFVIYLVLVASYGYWVYNRKKKANVTASHDYFLAEGSLTWWAIGASLIASNISAEQFIGMSGEGFFCWHCSSRLRMDRGHCADHHRRMVYSCLPEKQDLHHAAILKNKV